MKNYRFSDVATPKAVFLVNGTVTASLPALGELSANELIKFAHSWAKLGDTIDRTFGIRLEPPAPYAEEHARSIADLLVRIGMLAYHLPRAERAEFILKFAECVLIYFGIKMRSRKKVYPQLRQVVESALSKPNDEQLNLLIDRGNLSNCFRFTTNASNYGIREVELKLLEGNDINSEIPPVQLRRAIYFAWGL